MFTSSHHIFSSAHVLIFTSSHLHILSSSHLHIFSSSHLHMFTPFPSLPSPPLPFPSLPSPPLPFPSLPPALPSPFPFPSLPFPSFPFPHDVLNLAQKASRRKVFDWHGSKFLHILDTQAELELKSVIFEQVTCYFGQNGGPASSTASSTSTAPMSLRSTMLPYHNSRCSLVRHRQSTSRLCAWTQSASHRRLLLRK